jgi:arginine utilization protein RocB
MNEEKDPIEEVSEESNQEAAPEKSQARTYTDDDLNRILARERRQATVKYNALQAQFETLQQEMDKKREAEEAILMEKVNKLREGQPKHVLSLLDKLDPQEQLEWLSGEDAKVVETKKTIPALPEAKEKAPTQRKSIGTII